MATIYSEVPKNWSSIEKNVITEPDRIANALLYGYDKVFFYDTCSFRGHSNLDNQDAAYIMKHIKQEHGVVVITRCILMELASKSGLLNQEYIDFIIRMTAFYEIEVLVMNEEDLYTVLSECFSTSTEINSYLMWSVRMLGVPTSTIEVTLSEKKELKRKLKEGKGLTTPNLYADFFTAVRNNKTESDNLGEELLAICLHILSHVPGNPDYKFNVITEDKGARAVISTLFEKTREQFAGQKIILYSTPKLVQTMVHLSRISDCNSISRILSLGSQGHISIYGVTPNEFETTKHTFDTEELAKLLLTPNGIDIRF